MRPKPAWQRRQTIRNYEAAWRGLHGEPDLRSPYWQEGAANFLARQELRIQREWFAGRSVLEVGCGGGRWTYALQRLGCQITAFDASGEAVEVVRQQVAQPPTQVLQADLFSLPPELAACPYDLVFAWGVLHHTGDTCQALHTIAGLVKPDGVLYVYLYGRDAWSPTKTMVIQALRWLLLPVPPKLKFYLFYLLLGDYKAGVAMDVLGSLIAQRFRPDEVDGWLQDLGFTEIVATRPGPDIYRRCSRAGCSAKPYFLPPSRAPYWAAQWKKENYGNVSRE